MNLPGNLPGLLRAAAERHPERESVVWKSERLNYATLFERAARLSSFLIEQGVRSGDRVALVMENSPNYLASYFGVLMARACVVALNPNTTAHELKHPLAECEASAIIAQRSAIATLRPLLSDLPALKWLVLEEARDEASAEGSCRLASLQDAWATPAHHGGQSDAGALAQIIYTSGTTGAPKGVMLTHRNLLANTESIVEYLRLTAEDRVLVILPFFYSYGNSLLLTHVAVGGALVIADQFVFLNGVLSLMQEEGVTGFSGVPSSFAMLLRKSLFPKTCFESLRYLTCAGGALPLAHLQELRAAHPKTDVVVMYGQTEASARLSYLDPKDLPRKMGSIGKGIPGVDLQVLGPDGAPVGPGETGEIVASGDCIMSGYWKHPEETAKVVVGGRLHTGDMATVDADGYLFVKGRKSDIIKCGSYRIHPIEVEAALNAHPQVVESAVVGVKDEMLGESIVAFVVLQQDCAVTASDLLLKVRKFLPMHKLPKKIIFTDAIPKTATGKIRRSVLRLQ